ncbi:MAG TPA: hypothetical protein VND91_02235 [Candidatus Saccharimonadia bacterium]|nr:hypothetical protein [Candidatus Saccharimonadia bacterium]
MTVRRASAVLALAAVALAGAPPARAQVALQYEGTARGGDGAFAYRETHYLERAGDGSGERLVLYRCADGRAFARKLVRYGAGSLAPDFALEDARTGYREGVRTRDDAREVYVRAGEAARERRKVLPRVAGLVADAGFDDFVARHWDALAAGRAVRVPFLVPAELDSFAFKVRRTRTLQLDGQAAVVLRLSLGAWYGLFLPHIDATYTVADRTLRSYEGLSNIRDLKLENVVVRIEFAPASRKPLDPGAREQARTGALVRSCD